MGVISSNDKNHNCILYDDRSHCWNIEERDGYYTSYSCYTCSSTTDWYYVIGTCKYCGYSMYLMQCENCESIIHGYEQTDGSIRYSPTSSGTHTCLNCGGDGKMDYYCSTHATSDSYHCPHGETFQHDS